MRHRLRWIGILLLVLSGCGGGGGGGSGGGTSISISPSSLSFQLSSDRTSGQQSVDVHFTGDGVVVGFAPGVSPPGWLQVTQQTSVLNGEVGFVVSASTNFLPLAPGQYSTTLRFATGKSPNGDINNATDIKIADLPVSMRVSDFSVQPLQLSLEVVDGGTGATIPALNTIAINGSQLNWSINSDAGWLGIDHPTGNAAGSVHLLVNAASLPRGSQVAHLSIHNATTQETATVTVSLQKRLPRLVAQFTQVTAPSFVVNQQTPASALQQAFIITDELNGTDSSRAVSWSLQSTSAPWLSAGPVGATGSSVPSKNLTLALVPGELTKLRNGDHDGELVFRYQNAEVAAGELRVPVHLDLRLPRLSSVAPYLVFTPQPQEVVVRGEALSNANLSQLGIGTSSPTSVSVVNDTTLRVQPPALGVGRYGLRLPNAAGIDVSRAELVVRDGFAYPYAAFPGPGNGLIPYLRLFFDDERATLYGVDNIHHQLDRFVFNDSGWMRDTALPIPGLADAELSIDGKSIIAVGDNGLQTLDLTGIPLQLRTLAAIPTDSFISPFFATLGVLSNGKIVVMEDSHCCSGIFPGYLFDPQTALLPRMYDAPARPTAKTLLDNSRVYVNEGSGGNPAYIDALDGSYHRSLLYPIGISSNGNRLTTIVTLNDGRRRVRVFDGNQNPLGDLSTLQDAPQASGEGLSQPLLSPDGRTAYLFGCLGDGTGENGRVVRVADLGAAPVNGFYPITRTIDLPDAPYVYAAGGFPCADIFQRLVISADGGTAFLAGTENLMIVPLR